jgi:hypothetical protein
LIHRVVAFRTAADASEHGGAALCLLFGHFCDSLHDCVILITRSRQIRVEDGARNAPAKRKNSLMKASLDQNFPLYFPIFFVLMWFAVTVLLGFMSGWYSLMRRFPDRPETPLRTFKNQSGTIGFVSTRSLLTLSVCPSGLRVGMMRIFGPFSKDFFVPWNEMNVSRKDWLLWKAAKISFGNPPGGSLTLMADLADRLARLAGKSWPEPGSFPEETNTEASSRILKQWVAMTGCAAAFFIIVPRLVAPNGADWPPTAVAILFPAIVFGIAAIVQYLRRQRP